MAVILGGVGGLQLCQPLRQKLVVGNRTWRAYLSNQQSRCSRSRSGGCGALDTPREGSRLKVEELDSGATSQRHGLDEPGRPSTRRARPPPTSAVLRWKSGPRRRVRTGSVTASRRNVWASRSAHVRQTWIALELGPPVQGLLAGESGGDRWRRPGLLLRGQVTQTGMHVSRKYKTRAQEIMRNVGQIPIRIS